MKLKKSFISLIIWLCLAIACISAVSAAEFSNGAGGTVSMDVTNATVSEAGVLSASVSGTTTTGWYGSNNKTDNITITVANTGANMVKLSGPIKLTAINGSGDKINPNGRYNIGIGSVQTSDLTTTVITAGTTVTVDNVYEIPSGSSLKIYLRSPAGTEGTTTLEWAVTAREYVQYDVTFDTAANGSFTVSGTAITESTKIEDIVASDGIEITVTPDSGYVCTGFADAATGKLLMGMDDGKTATFYPSADNMSVVPVFVSGLSETPFGVVIDSTTKNYYTWESAMIAGRGKTVVLNKDYSLPTTLAANGLTAVGNYVTGSDNNMTYTVPGGTTFLVPCDDANTLYTTQPGDDGYCYFEEAAIFRKLSMASGTKITVDGAISIGGKIGTYMVLSEYSNQPPYTNGAPCGNLGQIDMASNSSITVSNGGNLYAWGYITGLGSVTIQNGGNVYEDLQIRDYHGGGNTSDMKDNEQRVFPFTQYYVQNIEVPLTMEVGATETVCMAVSVTGITNSSKKTNAVFIGKDSGLIRLTSGSMTKNYDGTKDRIIYELDGDISFANLKMVISHTSLISITINSEDYVMPINSNMTLNVNAGSSVTLNQDLALLPGTIVEIEEGAICTLSSGTKLYVYDQDQWSANYVGLTKVPLNAVYYAPGRSYTRTNADLVDAEIILDGTIDATAGSIYTTESGANIRSNGSGKIIITPGTDTNTYQYIQSSETYSPISITSAQLKNGDGSCVTTDGAASATTYEYIDGFWRYIPVAARYDANGTQQETYLTLGRALSDTDYDGTGYIQMLADTTEADITAEKTVYLDLNGKNINANLTLTALYAIDSATNALGADGSSYGTITGTVAATLDTVYQCTFGPHINKTYVAVQDTASSPNTLSFHRVRFGIDSYTYYVSNTTGEVLAITFSATYLGDDAAMDGMTRLGMEVDGTDVFYPANPTDKEKTGLTERTEAPTGYILQRTVTDPATDASYAVSALLDVNGTVMESDSYSASVAVSDLGGE